MLAYGIIIHILALIGAAFLFALATTPNKNN
jgi:hypothetical protein